MIARDASSDAARDASLVAAYHRLQISFDNPIAPSAVLDASGRLVDVSPSLASLFGLEPEDMEGLPFQQLTYPEDVEIALQHFRQVAAGELPFCIDRRRFFHRDGRVVPLLVHLAPVPIDQERARRELLVTVVSLEREAEFERELRSVQERYDSLVNDLPIVIFTSPRDSIDQQMNFLSSQAATMLGFPMAYLANDDHFYAQIHRDDIERVNLADERAARDNAAFDETYRFLRGDGRLIWVRAQSVPVFGERDEASYWQGVLTDVTQLKETELAAIGRERRLSNLLAIAPMLVAALDRDAAIVWINDAVELLLGYRAVDLVSGQATLDIHPDDRDVLRREFSDVLHEAASAATIDIRLRHRQAGWQRFRLDIRLHRGEAAPELLLYAWPIDQIEE